VGGGSLLFCVGLGEGEECERGVVAMGVCVEGGVGGVGLCGMGVCGEGGVCTHLILVVCGVCGEGDV